MNIYNDIAELVKAGIIPEETGNKIRNYYKEKSGHSQNKHFIVFGILGAILVGLGIILIIAHNWDELTRATKTVLAFFPLIIGQALCIFTLIKKQESIAWRESSTAFLFFAVGASISLVSQVYNIPGNLSSFLLTWMLLCLPLIYLMKSSVASLLYLIGITYYAGEANYWSHPPAESYYYWFLLMAALPYYYQLYKKTPGSNFMIFHNWLVPISLTIVLGTVAYSTEELNYVAYMSLFGLFFLIGNTAFYKRQNLINNGYLVLGSLGTISLLLALSFDWFWEGLSKQNFLSGEVIASPEFIAAVLISLLALGLLFQQRRNRHIIEISPVELIFIFFIIIFLIGLVSPIAEFLVNILIFVIGIFTIRNGARLNHLGILNYGLLIIMALAVCKFFDTNLSFVTRGILFVSVGIGFFVANYLMLKKRKENE